MFLSRNKKNNVYPCKPQFYYIKVGFKGVKIIQVCFCDDLIWVNTVRPGPSVPILWVIMVVSKKPFSIAALNISLESVMR